jgi:hypothetical protein
VLTHIILNLIDTELTIVFPSSDLNKDMEHKMAGVQQVLRTKP